MRGTRGNERDKKQQDQLNTRAAGVMVRFEPTPLSLVRGMRGNERDKEQTEYLTEGWA
jgi:hypothetical protein